MSGAAPAPARLDWRAARLLSREAVTARVALFRFAVDWPAPHRAGQHVELRVTAPDGYRAMRRYSIASPPSRQGEIDLLVALAEDGEVSPFLHEVAEAGDAVEIRGPIGAPFAWRPEDGGPLLLVGGGLGVAPLLAMARERAASAPAIPAALLYAARTRADAPHLDELEARSRDETGFALVLRLSRADGAKRIDRASMDEALRRLPSAPGLSFVCGPSGFVSAAADLLLAAGVAPGSIRTERFG